MYISLTDIPMDKLVDGLTPTLLRLFGHPSLTPRERCLFTTGVLTGVSYANEEIKKEEKTKKCQTN